MNHLILVLLIICLGINIEYATALPQSDMDIFIESMDTDTLPEPDGKKDAILLEYMPHFAGCEHLDTNEERQKCSKEKLAQYLSNNLVYPMEAREYGVEGSAVIQFIIDKDGSVLTDSVDYKNILRDPGAGCGDEALRVVRSMPNWIPGRTNEGNVKVEFRLPIRFKLEGRKKKKKKKRRGNKD